MKGFKRVRETGVQQLVGKGSGAGQRLIGVKLQDSCVEAWEDELPAHKMWGRWSGLEVELNMRIRNGECVDLKARSSKKDNREDHEYSIMRGEGRRAFFVEEKGYKKGLGDGNGRH